MDSNQSVSLSPTLPTPTPHPSIRAPLSYDSDFESALKTHSRSNSIGSISGTSAKSFVSEEEEEEEGFLSGEDGFETASEKHEDNLELASMEGEDSLAKPALGSSRFSNAPPKARVSFDDEDYDEEDAASDVVDDGDSNTVGIPDGIEKLDKGVEVSGVLEGQKDKEEDGSSRHHENGVVSGNPVLGSGEIVEQKGLVEDKVPDGDTLVEEKVPDAVKASVEEKVPDTQEAEVDALPGSKEDVLRENQNLSDTPENGVLDSQGKGVSNDSATLVEGGDSDSVVSEVSQEPLVAHKEDISTEFPKLDVVVNPENGVQEKAEVEPVQEDIKEVSVEAVVPKKPYKDVLLDSPKLDAVASREIGVEGKEEVEPVQEKETEEVSVEELVVNKKDEDASKLDVVVKPEIGMEEVETEVEALEQKQSEEGVANKEIIVPTVQKTETVANTDIDVPEKEESEPVVEALQVKESVEVPNEAPKEDIVHEVPKLDSGVNPELGAPEKEESEPVVEALQVKESVEVPNEAPKEDIVHEVPKLDSGVNPELGTPEKEEVETKIEALQKGSEEVGGVQDEVDENKIAASVENVVPADSMLVEADKEVKSTSEEASLVATDIPAPGDVPDAAANVKPVESLNENSVDDGSSELNVSEKIPELVESSATETRDLEQQDIKINTVESQIDDDEKDSHGIASSPIIDSNDNSEKPEVGSEVKTDTGSELNGPAFRLTVDEDKDVSGDKKDGFGGDEMQDLNTKSIDAGIALQDESSEQPVSESPHMSKTTAPISDYDLDVKEEAEVEAEAEGEAGNLSDYQEGEGSSSDEDNDELNFGSSGTAEQIMKELMRGSGVSFRSGAESSQDGSQRNDGQILMDSDEEVDTDEEGEGKELFDSAALAALLKAATSAGPEGGNVTMTTQDGSRLFSVERPAGLGSSIRSLKPTSQPSRPNIFTSSEVMAGGESENPLTEEDKKKLEKLQHLRVKFLRLIHRIGHSPDEAIAAQVLYRMVLAAGRQTGQAFSLEAAKKTATQLEAENSNELDFSLNILVLGKTGVGKSATINSIFGEEKAKIGAFEPSTTEVRVITGTVGGVNIRILDTPGLRSSLMEQAFNRKVLSSVKKLTKKFPVDILLYVDRLDTQTRDLNDLPLLKVITSTLGSSIWKSAVVTLTHAASAPPDGPSGSPLSYEVFVAQRSHIIQQSIGQAVGDLRMMNPSLMNPVSLVENHPSCRKNRDGQRILPNGQVWRPQLLLLCYSLKVLSEVSSLSKPQDPFDHRKLFGFRVRAPPLPYLLSSLLQSRAHPKLPDDQGGDNVDSDIDLEDLSDSDREEEEDEYDQLPPFKPLRKAQIANLSNDQKKAYFDEYDYRVKLLQKKQWKEELKRMKEMKKRGKGQKDDFVNAGEDAEQEGPAAVPVPLPDMVLPPSFDGDNPAYRYRFLEPTSQLLARPVLDTHGWDHDCGYDGVSLEENLAIAGRFPGGVAVQITKDKKEFNIHLDSSIAAKHGENGSTLAGFDIQTIGKQLGYIVRGETKFKNFKKNRTTGGVSVTFLGENVATGLKVEDQICIGKRLTLVGSTGTIRSQGDAAYGANLEATLKDKDFPIGQDQATLGLSLMRWRGDLALGANLQSQFSIGRSSKMSVRVGLNNKLSGQITVRTSSSEQLQLALVGILPIAVSLYRSIWPSTGESFSAY